MKIRFATRDALKLVPYVSILTRKFPTAYFPVTRFLCNSLSQKFPLPQFHLSKVLLSKANTAQLKRYEALVEELNELREILTDSDDSLKTLIQNDYQRLSSKFSDLEEEIIDSLTHDKYTLVSECFIEVRPGVGGQEAMLFAGELFQVYLKYIKWNNWLISSVDDDFNGLGGLRSAGLEVKGNQCFRSFRHEAGIHRVQRIPKTEKSGRIHTSTVAVSVLPVINRAKDIVLDEKDLKVEFTTSSGPGGQHANRTPTCARIIHLPTNIQVVSQETRVAEQNKERALQRLRKILARRDDEKNYEDFKRIRQTQIGDMGRSEKVRTYNLVQDRITDHRLNESFFDIKSFMSGDPERLHKIIIKLEGQHKQEKLKHLLSL